MTTIAISDGTAPTEGAPSPPARGEETRKLLTRAQKGDTACLPQLRALFEDKDRGGWLIEAVGSPAAWLEETLLDQAAGKYLLVKEAVTRKLAQLRADPEGPDPTPIERLLAERAAACWFVVNRYEGIYANAGSMTLAQAEYHQKRIDRAHRRYLAALKTLATVRKLALPAIQVNIGEKQLNVAGNA